MNIWEISKTLSLLIDEVEENGGEITPELEEKLALTQENLKEKIKNYAEIVKGLNGDLDTIKAEQKRLKDVAESKQKTIDRLKKIMAEAIENFGTPSKSGAMYVDYGTGKVSVRTTKSVSVNNTSISAIKDSISDYFYNLIENNQLDVCDKVDKDELLQLINARAINTEDNDIGMLNCYIEFKVPFESLVNSPKVYEAIKNAILVDDDCNLEVTASKSQLKPLIEDKPMLCPDVAVIETNKSVVIK